MAKVTAWYPAKTKPARVGVYEIGGNSGFDTWYRYWDGKHWHCGWDNPGKAFRDRDGLIVVSRKEDWREPWRGLASPFAASNRQEGKP